MCGHLCDRLLYDRRTNSNSLSLSKREPHPVRSRLQDQILLKQAEHSDCLSRATQERNVGNPKGGPERTGKRAHWKDTLNDLRYGTVAHNRLRNCNHSVPRLTGNLRRSRFTKLRRKLEGGQKGYIRKDTRRSTQTVAVSTRRSEQRRYPPQWAHHGKCF